MRRLTRLTYANTMSTLAVVLALTTGGAYAAHQVTSKDIKNNTIKSKDIRDGAVTGTDIADHSVTASDLAVPPVPPTTTTQPVTGAEVTDGSLTGADVADGSLDGTDVKDNSLTGADVNENSLDLAGFFAATSADGACNADDGSLTTCALGTIALAHKARLLLNATGTWNTFALNDETGAGSDSDQPLLVRGVCSLQVDGSSIGDPATFGEYSASNNPTHPGPAPGTFAITALSAQLTTGTHSVSVACREDDGDIDFANINLTAATG